jgi:hypothetical protein
MKADGVPTTRHALALISSSLHFIHHNSLSMISTFLGKAKDKPGISAARRHPAAGKAYTSSVSWAHFETMFFTFVIGTKED